jgi:hypothetical protein
MKPCLIGYRHTEKEACDLACDCQHQYKGDRQLAMREMAGRGDWGRRAASP